MYYNLKTFTSHLPVGVTPPWSRLDAYERRYARLNDELESYNAKRDEAKEIIAAANVDLLEKKLPKLNATLEKQRREFDDLIKEGEQLLRDTDASSEKLEKIRERLLENIHNLDRFGSSHETTKNALAKARKLLKEMKGIRNKFKTEYEYKKITDDCDRVSENAANVSKMLVYPDDVKGKLRDFDGRISDLKEIALQADVANGKIEQLNMRNRARINNLTRMLESLDPYGTVDDINSGIKEVNEFREKIKDLLNKTEQNYNKLRSDAKYKELLQFLEEKERLLKEQNPQVQEYLRKVQEHVKNLEQNVTEYQK